MSDPRNFNHSVIYSSSTYSAAPVVLQYREIISPQIRISQNSSMQNPQSPQNLEEQSPQSPDIQSPESPGIESPDDLRPSSPELLNVIVNPRNIPLNNREVCILVLEI